MKKQLLRYCRTTNEWVLLGYAYKYKLFRVSCVDYDKLARFYILLNSNDK